jgi:hypothetical protein
MSAENAPRSAGNVASAAFYATAKTSSGERLMLPFSEVYFAVFSFLGAD